MTAQHQQWEYETEVFDANYQHTYRFNIMGDEGWELCGVVVPPNSNQAIYVFKRPKK